MTILGLALVVLGDLGLFTGLAVTRPDTATAAGSPHRSRQSSPADTRATVPPSSAPSRSSSERSPSPRRDSCDPSGTRHTVTGARCTAGALPMSSQRARVKVPQLVVRAEVSTGGQ